MSAASVGAARPRSRCRRTGGCRAPRPTWPASTKLVYRSNLLGADRALANRGGGNTSAKGIAVDHAGRETSVALGEGLGHGSRDDHGGRLRRPSAGRGPCARGARRDGRRGHGALPPVLRGDPRPAAAVDRDAPARVPAGRARRPHPSRRGHRPHRVPGRPRPRCERTFGDEAVWLEYERPGFQMSKRIAGLLREKPNARGVLLEKHGLVTWGESSEAAYESTLEFVGRAARALEEAGSGRFGLGGPKVREARRRRGRGRVGGVAAEAPRRVARRVRRGRAPGRPERRGDRVCFVRLERPRSARSAHPARTT